MTASAETEPQGPARSRLRCSDADRLALVRRLQDGVGAGLLTLDECTERTAAAYRATYLDELAALTADLPDPAPVAPGWRALASTAALQARTSALGVPTWSAAAPRRRLLVVLAGVLLALLFLAAVVAAATGHADGPPPFVRHEHPWR
jgi:hypothetical protein